MRSFGELDSNYIDEVALLKAFIEYKTLSYSELQEKGIVPVLNKQDRRNLFKNTIDKFKRWELIEPIPDSNPIAWNVVMEKAVAEYNRIIKEIEQKQLIEKYSFQYLQEEVKLNTRKLRRIMLYRVLAIVGFCTGTISFLTGLTLPDIIRALKHLFHMVSGTGN